MITGKKASFHVNVFVLGKGGGGQRVKGEVVPASGVHILDFFIMLKGFVSINSAIYMLPNMIPSIYDFKLKMQRRGDNTP